MRSVGHQNEGGRRVLLCALLKIECAHLVVFCRDLWSPAKGPTDMGTGVRHFWNARRCAEAPPPGGATWGKTLSAGGFAQKMIDFIWTCPY